MTAPFRRRSSSPSSSAAHVVVARLWGWRRHRRRAPLGGSARHTAQSVVRATLTLGVEVAEEASMRTSFGTLAAVAAGLVIASHSVAAHHGAAAFENDPAKRLVLKGVVTQWIWANPHTFLQFDVKGDDGQVVHWVVEASNPPDMQNRGWTNKSFKAGDEVTVTVRPVKSGRPVGSIIQVQFADGHVLSAVGGNPGAPAAQ